MHDDIRISEIMLVNYRQYSGTVIVRFPADRNTIAVLVGANGAGKSNFWNAIHWCLFGEEPHIKSENAPSIINMARLYEAERGDNKALKMSVQIIMKSGDTKYLVRRQMEGLLNFLKRDENNTLVMSSTDPVPYGVQMVKNSTLFQRSEKSGPWETLSTKHDFGSLVNEHIIPENLSHFFILDGEFLQDLFDKFKDIKTGIDQISQIHVLNDALGLMERTRFPPKRRGNRDIASIDDNIKRIDQILNSEDYGGVKNTSTTEYIYGTDEPVHASGRPRKVDLERSINAMEERRDDLNVEISASDAAKKLKTVQRYDDATVRRDAAEERRDKLIGDHIDMLVSEGPFIMCKPSVERATKMIRAEMDKGRLPNIPRRILVADLLEKQECLCGTRLDDGTEARRLVEEEMRHIADEAQYDVANDMRYHTDRFLKNYDSTINRMDSEMADIHDARVEYTKLGEEVRGLKHMLPKDDADYGRLINERDDLVERIREAEKQLAATDLDIENKMKDRGNEIRRRNTIEKQTKEDREEAILLEKPDIIKSKMRAIKEDVEKTIREKVSRETLSIFNNLSWKKNYARLSINEKYHIQVADEDGFEIGGGMAAGEKLFLALSFIMALKRVTNYKFPFIIDSPLGKTGGNLRIRFGRHMPELLDGSQLIMLATNTEYNDNPIQPEDGRSAAPSLIEILKEKVAIREYKIDYDKETKTADILAAGGA